MFITLTTITSENPASFTERTFNAADICSFTEHTFHSTDLNLPKRGTKITWLAKSHTTFVTALPHQVAAALDAVNLTS